MSLKDALGLRSGEMMSLIGAGGKTTALYGLAKELRDNGAKVLVTTTTKIFKPVKPHVDRLFLVEEASALLATTLTIPAPVIVGAGYKVDDEEKLLGLPSSWLDQLSVSGQFDSILVEADGAASKLFKVPSEIEPVIPKSCHLTVWIMAIKVLGKPLNPSWIHRAERAISLLGVAADAQVTKDLILRLARNPFGPLKGIPSGSRKVALLNQADSPEEIDAAKDLARALLPLGFEKIVITSFLSETPVKDVILN
jgi:molybdenum cofactor cytidylyltransferase